MILRCHLFVPVWFWPVLWVYLRRLEATAALARAEGRKGFMWHVERNGVIWVSHMDASAAERAARGELPRDFCRTPWTRVLARGESALWAWLGGGVQSRTPATPSRHHDDTAMTPLAHRHGTPLRPP